MERLVPNVLARESSPVIQRVAEVKDRSLVRCLDLAKEDEEKGKSLTYMPIKH